jgi:hypothetical protein
VCTLSSKLKMHIWRKKQEATEREREREREREEREKN